MAELDNDSQYLLSSLVEHEAQADAGELVFVAAYGDPTRSGEPAAAALWSLDRDGQRREPVVDDGVVLATNAFRLLEEAGLVSTEREETERQQGAGWMTHAYVLTEAGRARAQGQD